MSFLGIKTRKNNTYSYTPRYYDERKERIREIENKHRVVSDEEYENGFRRNPSVIRGNNLFERPERKSNSNFRLMMIIVVLTIISYVIIGSFDLSIFFGN